MKFKCLTGFVHGLHLHLSHFNTHNPKKTSKQTSKRQHFHKFHNKTNFPIAYFFFQLHCHIQQKTAIMEMRFLRSSAPQYILVLLQSPFCCVIRRQHFKYCTSQWRYQAIQYGGAKVDHFGQAHGIVGDIRQSLKQACESCPCSSD